MSRVFIAKEIEPTTGHTLAAATAAVQSHAALDDGWTDMAFLTTVEEVHRTRGEGFDTKRCIGITSVDSENLLQLMLAEDVASLQRKTVLLEAEVEALREGKRSDALKIIQEKRNLQTLAKEKANFEEKLHKQSHTFEEMTNAREASLKATMAKSDDLEQQLTEAKKQLAESNTRSDDLERQLVSLRRSVASLAATAAEVALN
jgi:chromosome segregation ATPase